MATLSASGSALGPASGPYNGATLAPATLQPGATLYFWLIDYPDACTTGAGVAIALTSAGLPSPLKVTTKWTPCTPMVSAWQGGEDFPQ